MPIEDSVVQETKNSTREEQDTYDGRIAAERRNTAFITLKTVATSENSAGGDLERYAAYVRAAMAGLSENFITRLVKRGFKLRNNSGHSGSAEEHRELD